MAQIAPESHGLWTVQDLAAFLGVPVKTIYTWRHHGSGPQGIRVGRHVRWRPAEVERWLDQQQAAS